MADSELEYYRRRAAEELERAERAQLPAAEAAHCQLAEFYLDRVKVITAGAKPRLVGP